MQLRLEAGPADIILSVEDDGNALGGSLAPRAGMGLLGMQERVASLGGTLRFERPAAGGARLVATHTQYRVEIMSMSGTRKLHARHAGGRSCHRREGYRSLLQKQDHLRVVAEAGDGAEAYRVYKEARPDLVIMDVSMPGIGGVEAIRRIRQWDGSARILVFTMHQSAAYAVQAIKAGARGFVTKSNPPDALLRAIGEVMAGRIALSPDIDHELALNRLAGEPSAVDALSPREFEILQMLLAEKSVDDIAETLHISVKTAANTRYLIRSKLGVASDIELVRLALRQRIIAADMES